MYDCSMQEVLEAWVKLIALNTVMYSIQNSIQDRACRREFIEPKSRGRAGARSVLVSARRTAILTARGPRPPHCVAQLTPP